MCSRIGLSTYEVGPQLIKTSSLCSIGNFVLSFLHIDQVFRSQKTSSKVLLFHRDGNMGCDWWSEWYFYKVHRVVACGTEDVLHVMYIGLGSFVSTAYVFNSLFSLVNNLCWAMFLMLWLLGYLYSCVYPTPLRSYLAGVIVTSELEIFSIRGKNLTLENGLSRKQSYMS